MLSKFGFKSVNKSCMYLYTPCVEIATTSDMAQFWLLKRTFQVGLCDVRMLLLFCVLCRIGMALCESEGDKGYENMVAASSVKL